MRNETDQSNERRAGRGSARKALTRGLRPGSLLGLLGIAVALAGCGDSSTATEVELGPVGLAVTPASVVMDNYEELQLEAFQRFSDGRTLPLLEGVTWTSSSPDVATLSAMGLLSARLPGELIITVESRWGNASAPVTILPVSSDLRLEVAEELMAEAGSTEPQVLEARIVDVTGRPVPGIQVDFHASDESVSLQPGSALTGPDGVARTDVSVGDRAREFHILVSSPELDGTSVPVAQVAAGVDGPAGVWSQFRRWVRLLVSPSRPDRIEMVPDRAHLEVGAVQGFSAVVRDQYGNRVDTASVTWHNSGNGGILMVSAGGDASALAAGESDVVARFDDGSRQVEGSARVTVEAGAVAVPAQITRVSAATTTAPVLGDVDGLTVHVSDGDGRPVPGTVVNWSVSSEGSPQLDVAKNSTNAEGISTNSVVLGTRAGTVTVTARVDALPAVSFSIETEPGPADAIQVTPSQLSLQEGTGQTLSVTAADRFGNAISSPQVSWSSANPSVASVSASGEVGGMAAGTTTIQASSGLAEASVPVEVSSPPSDGDDGGSNAPGRVTDLSVSQSAESAITLRFTEVTNGAGGAADYQVRFHAAIPFSDFGTAQVVTSGTCASPLDQPLKGTSVGSTRTCTVEGLQPNTGYSFQMVSLRRDSGGWAFSPLSNVAEGTTTSGSGGDDDEGPSDETEPTRLHAQPSSVTLSSVGEQRTLSVAATNALGNQVPTPPVTWTSLSPGVVTVNGTGRITAQAAGTALIVVAAACCTSDTVQAVVDLPEPPPPANPTDWRPNQPNGWRTATDHDWSSLTGNGWGYNPWSGEVRTTQDPTMGSTAEFRYHQGFANGASVGWLGHYGVQGQQAFYFAFRVRFSDNWVHQSPGIKLLHLMAAGWNVHLDVFHPQQGWVERYGPVAGQFSLEPTGWNDLPSTHYSGGPTAFNNIDKSAAMVRTGQWQTVELLLDRRSGTIQMWVDGVLTASHSGLKIPSGGFENIHFNGTYGGGSHDVPHAQNFRISDSFLSVP